MCAQAARLCSNGGMSEENRRDVRLGLERHLARLWRYAAQIDLKNRRELLIGLNKRPYASVETMLSMATGMSPVCGARHKQPFWRV